MTGNTHKENKLDEKQDEASPPPKPVTHWALMSRSQATDLLETKTKKRRGEWGVERETGWRTASDR